MLDSLQDQGDYLVFFTDYLNEAVVGKGEMVESIHEMPPGELVDENIEKALDLLPSHSVLPVKMEEGEGQHIPEVFLTIQRGGETIKEVIECHFQPCFNSCRYAQNTPDQV